MRQPRIIHIITSLGSGGAEAMLYKLLGGMNEKRFDQSVVVLMDAGFYGSKIRSMGIPVNTLDMQRSRPKLRSIMKLRKLIADYDPALIQGWMYHGNLAAELAMTFAKDSTESIWNIRHSIDSLCHEKRLTRIVIRLGARLSSRPARIIYNARVSAIQHEEIGYSASGRVVLPNGFDTDEFRFSAAARKRIRAELNILDDEYLVGTVARYHPIKDVQNLIRSAALICESNPKLRFALVGSGMISSKPNINEPIVTAGLQSRFRLLGERTDIPDVMSAFDLFVLPSRSEAFPNVIGEAMACERPCVATDVGDCAALLGDHGILVSPGDSKALAGAILKMLAMTEHERREMGRSLRRRVVDNFALPHIVDKYQDLYRSALGLCD